MNLSIPRINIKNEVLAGLTVAMTMIPESLSFAILAGLPPLTGLYAAFLMGLVAAVLGGRPGMVSGGAGATIVVLMVLAADYGIQYLFVAVIMAGVFQMMVGIFKFGKFIKLIPQPVMYGFLNGLAIIIFWAQVQQFKVNVDGHSQWMSWPVLLPMLGLTALTIFIVLVFPKITKAIPSSLIAILIVFALVFFMDIDTKKVIDIASVKGGWPSFHIPEVPFNLATLKIVFPYALVMAGVGLIESLLTLNMVDEITNTKGNPNKESVAQGTANIVNGFFGGMGGCAMVAQTLVNLNAGARTKISAIIGAIAILLVILVASPFIEQIPMAALIGVMMIVAIKTFQWTSLKIINKFPKADIFVGVLVAVITVVLHNLALAVLVGVAIAALVFAWDNAKRIKVIAHAVKNGSRLYEVNGILFFGATATFLDKFEVDIDPAMVIVNFEKSRVADMSAIDALQKLTEKYESQNKQLILTGLNAESIRLIKNAEGIISVNIQNENITDHMPST